MLDEKSRARGKHDAEVAAVHGLVRDTGHVSILISETSVIATMRAYKETWHCTHDKHKALHGIVWGSQPAEQWRQQLCPGLHRET